MDIFYYYKATPIRVIDGDTVEMQIDLGFNLALTEKFRLIGINAPEMKNETLEAAKASRDFLKQLLFNAHAQKKQISLKSTKHGKYRWLAEIWIESRDVAEIMVESGHAVPYTGQ